jgi:hypothetical protein
VHEACHVHKPQRNITLAWLCSSQWGIFYIQIKGKKNLGEIRQSLSLHSGKKGSLAQLV